MKALMSQLTFERLAICFELKISINLDDLTQPPKLNPYRAVTCIHGCFQARGISTDKHKHTRLVIRSCSISASIVVDEDEVEALSESTGCCFTD